MLTPLQLARLYSAVSLTGLVVVAGVFDATFIPGPFDSDQNLIENASGTLLFAVNSGSNTIAVFHIQSDGSLAPVHGSPFIPARSESNMQRIAWRKTL